jgi:tetratricopeptide (TPR) repeat protein
MIANTYSNEDAYDRAEPLLRRSIALAEEHHDAFAEAFARLSLGILLVERGAFDEAFSALIDSLSIFETSRSARVMQARHLRAVALTHLARVKQETGDTAGALTDYHEAVAYAEETGVRRAEAFALYGLGSLLLELGELRAADDRIRAALPLMRESCRDVEGALVALQGVLFALRGARADAERFFRRAEALLAAHQRPVFEAALKVLRGADPGRPPSPSSPTCASRCASARSSPRRETARPLFVAHDASFFRAPDSAEQVSLARRKALRAILRTLVEARLARPGVPLSVEALVAAGWPGRRSSPPQAPSACTPPSRPCAGLASAAF